MEQNFYDITGKYNEILFEEQITPKQQDNKKTENKKHEENNLFYMDPLIKSPNGKLIKILYADSTATGKPSPLVDNYISRKILPFNANTHSNSYCGKYMSKMIDIVRYKIKKTYNVKNNQVILFSGNGTTGAINHLVNSIDYDKYNNVHVFISKYEHHSNYLPWFEKRHERNNFNIWISPLKGCDIDIDFIENKIKELYQPNNLYIISVTGCSNVTGIITDLDKLNNIVKKYNKNNNIKLFADCATLAPYRKINCGILNGMFFSGHKFIGGYGTPGVLIADKNLFNKQKPFIQGGGCIEYANDEIVKYSDKIEDREMAGTPNIIGIIKLGKVFDILNSMYDQMIKREHELTNYVFSKFELIKKNNPNLNVLFPMCGLNHRLPIVSFYIKGIHFNLITAIMSDYFGIQVRGGIACCGILGNHLYKKSKINGWCRITFSWYMSNDEINYILKTIDHIAKHIEEYKEKYRFNLFDHMYHHIQNKTNKSNK